MSQITEARSQATTSQRNEPPTDIDLEARFEAWDCKSEAIRTWVLGTPKRVVSLVRLLDEAADEEEMGFATSMEVTIAPTPLYQPSPSWRERIRGTYQVGVYPNANPDWGEIEAEVGTLADALAAAERVCSDLEGKYDLQRAGEGEEERAERESGEIALSWRGPKPLV